MNSTNKTTKSIVLAAGLATVAAISLYFVLKRSSKKKIPHIETTSKKLLTEQEKDDIIRQIKLTYNGKLISADSIFAISVACDKIAAPEIDNLLATHKKLRRGYKNNLALYVKECETFFNNCVQVELKESKKVFDSLGISLQIYEQMIMYYESQGEKKIVDLQNIAKRAEAKERNLKVLPVDKLTTILTRMTQLYEAERVNIPNVNRLLNMPIVGPIITSRVSDIIYEEFGVEQEDFEMAFAVHSELLGSQRPELKERYLKAVDSVNYVGYA